MDLLRVVRISVFLSFLFFIIVGITLWSVTGLPDKHREFLSIFGLVNVFVFLILLPIEGILQDQELSEHLETMHRMSRATSDEWNNRKECAGLHENCNQDIGSK